VLLAQTFTDRIVGLRAGEVVFDDAPSSLSPEVLTRIYGEEDWTVLQRRRDEEERDSDKLEAIDVELERRASLA
jgi:phosphonate transport system ATP-binding protein